MFIKPTVVRAFVHGREKRCTKAFLARLDRYVEEKLAAWCKGTTRKTLDHDVFMGVPSTPRKGDR